jgi:hypothetical protein
MVYGKKVPGLHGFFIFLRFCRIGAIFTVLQENLQKSLARLCHFIASPGPAGASRAGPEDFVGEGESPDVLVVVL